MRCGYWQVFNNVHRNNLTDKKTKKRTRLKPGQRVILNLSAGHDLTVTGKFLSLLRAYLFIGFRWVGGLSPPIYSDLGYLVLVSFTQQDLKLRFFVLFRYSGRSYGFLYDFV